MSDITLLPLFPLNLFLLPGERTQLHIFEDRYKLLMSHCQEETNVFGMACNAQENTKNLGSMVRISRILKRYPNGELDIEIACFGLFRLKKFFYRMEGSPWPGGYVEAYQNELLQAGEGAAAPSTTSSLLKKALGLQLSIHDKLLFARIQDISEQERFIESRKRLMSLLEEQEASRYRETIYLN